ncbi:MAG: hypothetical protein PHT40_03750 [Patescibacteria group bacterium]|nr:hypothetical protein [Patescibacteria group bacterium]
MELFEGKLIIDNRDGKLGTIVAYYPGAPNAIIHKEGEWAPGCLVEIVHLQEPERKREIFDTKKCGEGMGENECAFLFYFGDGLGCCGPCQSGPPKDNKKISKRWPTNQYPDCQLPETVANKKNTVGNLLRILDQLQLRRLEAYKNVLIERQTHEISPGQSLVKEVAKGKSQCELIYQKAAVAYSELSTFLMDSLVKIEVPEDLAVLLPNQSATQDVASLASQKEKIKKSS